MQRASATPEVIDQILVIGQQRQPNEACGIVMYPNLVIELPNVAGNPRQAYEIDNEDLVKTLAQRIMTIDTIEREDILIWHTHPSGLVGPSQGDLDARVEGFRYLVVAMPRGKAALF